MAAFLAGHLVITMLVIMTMRVMMMVAIYITFLNYIKTRFVPRCVKKTMIPPAKPCRPSASFGLVVIMFMKGVIVVMVMMANRVIIVFQQIIMRRRCRLPGRHRGRVKADDILGKS